MEQIDLHYYDSKEFNSCVNTIFKVIQKGNQIYQIFKTIKDTTALGDAVIAANKVLINNNEDVTNIEKHTFLLESIIYHMARQINDLKRHSKEELNIEGMNNRVCIYDKLYGYVQKLEIGQEIKNYKELCKILHQDTKGGKQKTLQTLNFQRYFEYKEVGQKFIITDIYSEPLEKEDKRRLGNNSIYVKYIEVILLHFLSKQDKYTCILRKNQIWLLLGMINNKYDKIQTKNLEELDYCINPFMVNHFYQRCNQRLERILFSAMNNLKNRKLLSYQEQIIIIPLEGQGFIAGDNDIRRLDAVAHSVLESMGLTNMIQVYCKFKSKEFYDEVNDRLSELYGWKYSFKQYKLIYTPENIIKAIPESEIELQKLTLNKQIIETINNNAISLLEKNEEKWNKAYEEAIKEWKEWSSQDIGELQIPENQIVDDKGKKAFRYPPYYLEAQRLLADELLRIGNKKDTDSLSAKEKLDKELDDLFSCLKI